MESKERKGRMVRLAHLVDFGYSAVSPNGYFSNPLNWIFPLWGFSKYVKGKREREGGGGVNFWEE